MTQTRVMPKSEELKKVDELSFRLAESAGKVVDYLESKLDKNGSYGKEAKDIACHFKSPMMFLIAEKPHCAVAVLNHIETTFMTAEGDFKSSAVLKSVNPAYIEYWTYTNGWIYRAANQLGIKNICQRANQYLKLYRLGDTASFSTNHIDKNPKMTDVLTVAHHGLINLEMGNLDIAINAGNYLCRAFSKQTNLDNGFYLRLTSEENVITDFDKDLTSFYFVSKTNPNQLHFMLGYPAAYLAILYKKTNNQDFLNAAKKYLDFSLSCDVSVYTCEFSHKIAWAASLIYECTGDAKYLEVIDRISAYFITKQKKDGMWYPEDINKLYDQSAEIACWFLDIVKNLKEFKKNFNLDSSPQSCK